LQHTDDLPFVYSVFGLLLRSNLPLPGVPPVSRPDGAALAASERPSVSVAAARGHGEPAFRDLSIHLAAPSPWLTNATSKEELQYTSAYLDESGAPVLKIWRGPEDSFLRLDYSDGTQFWFDHGRENLWAAWPAALTLENALSYLLGPVLGLLLRLRGIVCLHASAVAFGDRCAVFVGTEGAGKSTTAAAFARKGYPVLSDDIVALAIISDGTKQEPVAPRFQVLPAYPHLCLWPDSAEMIGSPAELPRLSPLGEKRRLILGSDGTRFASRPLPLGAIYLFAPRQGDPAPTIAPAPAKSSLLSLLANTYANNLLDKQMRAAEFTVLDRLVAGVPIRILTPHQEPGRLERLCTMVAQDFRGLP